ncbi:peptide chain release factor 2 [Neomegalonema perideroedes]|uniref:peptide chain release factor 2 n=1 Tax=Neomegalonema perideroedes TaxID=217219 RepID=UPI00036A612C|nr:peptide chain release factor 2 [Neomegalonema perideroedes]
MRAETQSVVEEIRQSLALLRRRLDWETAPLRLEELNARAEAPDLWNDPAKAQQVMRDRRILEESINGYRTLEGGLEDNLGFIELGEAEGDAEIVTEAETALAALREKAHRAEMEALLSGEADGNDAYLEVHAGAGGTESCDWALMLSRMYLRWAEKRGYKIELMEETLGEEAGLKSATYQIKGENAYGWLKNETGVHRLVRISPFDSQARRHTSFSSVLCYPVIDDTIVIEVQDKDIRIDTMRASGAGGQHVNKTDSAVRITHLPTGIVVTSSEKSQHQNRDIAMKALKSRLYEMELQKRADADAAMRDSQGENGWGHQIRSYVLQPYQMVKDLRTGHETSDSQGVLDGDLDDFMGASLAANAAGKSRADAQGE